MLRFTRKRECFANYARLADHQDRSGFDPAQGQIDTGVVPPAARLRRRQAAGGHRIPGMDSFKETSVALANDRWLMRGVACWRSTDGPVRKSAARPLCVDAELDRCRSALVDWLLRPEIDAQKIGITGSSFGSSSEPF